MQAQPVAQPPSPWERSKNKHPISEDRVTIHYKAQGTKSKQPYMIIFFYDEQPCKLVLMVPTPARRKELNLPLRTELDGRAVEKMDRAAYIEECRELLQSIVKGEKTANGEIIEPKPSDTGNKKTKVYVGEIVGCQQNPASLKFDPESGKTVLADTIFALEFFWEMQDMYYSIEHNALEPVFVESGAKKGDRVKITQSWYEGTDDVSFKVEKIDSEDKVIVEEEKPAANRAKKKTPAEGKKKAKANKTFQGVLLDCGPVWRKRDDAVVARKLKKAGPFSWAEHPGVTERLLDIEDKKFLYQKELRFLIQELENLANEEALMEWINIYFFKHFAVHLGMENDKTKIICGNGLEPAIDEAGANTGDHIIVTELGTKPVEVNVDPDENDGKHLKNVDYKQYKVEVLPQNNV